MLGIFLLHVLSLLLFVFTLTLQFNSKHQSEIDNNHNFAWCFIQKEHLCDPNQSLNQFEQEKLNDLLWAGCENQDRIGIYIQKINRNSMNMTQDFETRKLQAEVMLAKWFPDCVLNFAYVIWIYSDGVKTCQGHGRVGAKLTFWDMKPICKDEMNRTDNLFHFVMGVGYYTRKAVAVKDGRMEVQGVSCKVLVFVFILCLLPAVICALIILKYKNRQFLKSREKKESIAEEKNNEPNDEKQSVNDKIEAPAPIEDRHESENEEWGNPSSLEIVGEKIKAKPNRRNVRRHTTPIKFCPKIEASSDISNNVTIGEREELIGSNRPSL